MTDNPSTPPTAVITTQDIEVIVARVLATKKYVTADEVRSIVDASIATQTKTVDGRFTDLVDKIQALKELVISFDTHLRAAELGTQNYMQQVSRLEGTVSLFTTSLDRLNARLDSNDKDDNKRDARLTRLEEVVIGEPATPGVTPLFKSIEMLQSTIASGFAEMKAHTDERIAPIEQWAMSRRSIEQRVIGVARFVAKHPKWLLLLGGSGLGAIVFEFLRSIGVIP